jgi:mannose-6-phosphate isomerase-like protein (cupin superfamily)
MRRGTGTQRHSQEEGSTMTKIREFATTWGSPQPRTWFDREKEALIGAAKGSKYDFPNFRPFDMLAEPNQSLLVWQNEDMRIGVESVVGTAPCFRRHSDFDTLWFQFAGRTTVETEHGVFEQATGELLLVPAGIAHRSTGSADCLRLFAYLPEPVEILYGEDKYTSHTEFEMVREGGPRWALPDGAAEPPRGQVQEHTYTWADAEPMVVARDYDYLVGAASGGRPVQKLRAFDFFTEVTGKRGPGPKLMESSVFNVEVYNTEGDQWAFHRALDSVEMWLQFRGDSINESEFGAVHLLPGEMNYAPVGVPHRVADCKDFLRLVLYSKRTWQLMVDPTRHHYQSRFEAKTRVLQAAAWRQ